MAEAKTNLLGMPRAELESFFAALGEAPYRAEQVMRWIYRAKVTDVDAMTNISKSLRGHLKQIAEIRVPEFSVGTRSSDGVVKWLAFTEQGQAVETVLIPDAGAAYDGVAENSTPARRNTLCISSQVGCALDCSFCATGKQGFNGNLSRAEIVGQVWQASRELAARGDARGITNVVFMGMGEPLLNFEPVLDAADVLMDDLAFGISKRRVTISTAGVVPRIRAMASHTDVSLAVSLHAPRDELRNVLVPLNRKYPIADLLDACRHYLRGLGERRAITMEYTLIEGVNDSAGDARDLAHLLAGLRAKVNLIPFNPFPEDRNGYRRPSPARIAKFQTILLNEGVATMLRTTRGDEIGAACGQLTGTVHDRTQRRMRYLAREGVSAPTRTAP
ncbi:MAG: 23S rRNA (adenine(2503)-C(2))-methyltransferase RlmN [Gammaproteobacteria bacterium]|nr:23S rRNA (adenine(2503)-C(2))-methyltransferase RlmN [Gammaproteobacteria bacterium]